MRVDSRRRRHSAGLLLSAVVLVAGLAALAACAINPATGQSQLSLFTEAEEIALGAEVDREFQSNFATYPDPALEAYVADLGRRLAARSERPDLPWSFRIVDDEIVNAFALPGGRVYVTRGLLAHLEREAELAGVLGHEIGHVTARHTVGGLSRELAISLGVVAGLELLEMGETGELATSMGLGLLFLKFGRDQERQADQLGVRYARRAGVDPHGVVDALRVLQQVSRAQGDGWFPVWLSTHPDPERRWQRLAAEAGLGPRPPEGALRPEVDQYLARLEGLVYGTDPRHGILRENSYIHLREDFQLTLPAGWKTERDGQTVTAESPSEDAVVMLLPRPGDTPEEAARAFAEEEGVEVGEAWDGVMGGLPTRLVYLRVEVDGESLAGMAAFVRQRGRVVAVLGLSTVESWSAHRRVLERSLRSVGRVREPRRWPSEPERLAIVTLDDPLDAGEIARRYSPGVEPATLALLNRVGAEERIPAGRRVKVVRGVDGFSRCRDP